MAFVVKVIKTLRNNWKKSIFFTGVAAYGVHYANGVYEDSLIRRAYCEQAKKYGEVPLRTGDRAQKVTVFLNPAAQKGKAKKLFDKNVAPILNLAGLEVTVVRTEYEGQAKKYMDVLESTDAILVAGGDGTLAEVITGLLRRKDEATFSKIPIGVIPLGFTNSLARSLFRNDKSNAKWLLDAALAVVYGSTKPIDIMSITGDGDEDKSVYAVDSLEWGAFKEAEIRAKKYWYFGPLKKYWTYVMSGTRPWPPCVHARLSYSYPCDGCSTCFKPPEKPQWRWWHFFLPPSIDVPKKDYSEITNTECGVEHEEDISTLQLKAATRNTDNNKNEADPTGIKLSLDTDSVTRSDFIKIGNERRKGNSTENRTLLVQNFSLTPQGKQAHDFYVIDNEPYEYKPLKVQLLRDKINVFYPSTL